ncbi:MAG: cell division protein FtsQ [Gammaproteobacteria bacterium]|jgi:cell division protein FtsQ
MMGRFFKSKQATRKNLTQPAPTLDWRPFCQIVLAAIPLLAVVIFISQLDHLFPIKGIELRGEFAHISRSDIETRIEPVIGAGFFSVNIHQLQQQLDQDSWIASTSIRRVWPNRLRISILEHQPLARWDENHLLSDQAKVFEANTLEFNALPEIYAATESSEIILARYLRYQNRFEHLNESIHALNVDLRGAVKLELGGGLLINLGREDVERKLDRLMSIYHDEVFPRRQFIDRLDLRYSNGIAVAWKANWIKQQEIASNRSNDNV